MINGPLVVIKITHGRSLGGLEQEWVAHNSTRTHILNILLPARLFAGFIWRIMPVNGQVSNQVTIYAHPCKSQACWFKTLFPVDLTDMLEDRIFIISS